MKLACVWEEQICMNFCFRLFVLYFDILISIFLSAFLSSFFLSVLSFFLFLFLSYFVCLFVCLFVSFFFPFFMSSYFLLLLVPVLFSVFLYFLFGSIIPCLVSPPTLPLSNSCFLFWVVLLNIVDKTWPCCWARNCVDNCDIDCCSSIVVDEDLDISSGWLTGSDVAEDGWSVQFGHGEQCGPTKGLLSHSGGCRVPLLLLTPTEKQSYGLSRLCAGLRVQLPVYPHLLLCRSPNATGLGDQEWGDIETCAWVWFTVRESCAKGQLQSLVHGLSGYSGRTDVETAGDRSGCSGWPSVFCVSHFTVCDCPWQVVYLCVSRLFWYGTSLSVANGSGVNVRSASTHLYVLQ